MPRYWVARRAIFCATLLAAALPASGGAQSMSAALGRVVAKYFNSQVIFVVPTLPCFARGGNCQDYPEAGKGLDLDALTREIPKGVHVTSREHGGAIEATRIRECEAPLRCSVVGFVLLPPEGDSTVVRYKVLSSAVRGYRPRVAYEEDYVVALRRNGDKWEVLSVKRDRIT